MSSKLITEALSKPKNLSIKTSSLLDCSLTWAIRVFLSYLWVKEVVAWLRRRGRAVLCQRTTSESVILAGTKILTRPILLRRSSSTLARRWFRCRAFEMWPGLCFSHTNSFGTTFSATQVWVSSLSIIVYRVSSCIVYRLRSEYHRVSRLCRARKLLAWHGMARCGTVRQDVWTRPIFAIVNG